MIHAQRADRAGNVQLWGITGVQKEAVLRPRRSIVTVEEIVDELRPEPGAVVLPPGRHYVAVAPGGAQPSYALGYSVRDNDFYLAWDAISRDREPFSRWMAEMLRRAVRWRAGAAEFGSARRPRRPPATRTLPPSPPTR